MTLNCCTKNAKSEIRVVAEMNVEILFLPITEMEEWSANYKSWRNFVFDSYH